MTFQNIFELVAVTCALLVLACHWLAWAVEAENARKAERRKRGECERCGWPPRECACHYVGGIW